MTIRQFILISLLVLIVISVVAFLFQSFLAACIFSILVGFALATLIFSSSGDRLDREAQERESQI